uniref:Uncharacterized protein n=1 Tax=Entomophthora muscae TaxID=34485 RepID=A0ACC2SDQ7_9FUNG|nr:hypothetical protein DSO57_1031233 [Entomophthora muscae]
MMEPTMTDVADRQGKYEFKPINNIPPSNQGARLGPKSCPTKSSSEACETGISKGNGDGLGVMGGK